MKPRPHFCTVPVDEDVETDSPWRIATSEGRNAPGSARAGAAPVERPVGGHDELLDLLAAARADAVEREYAHELRFALTLVGIALLAAGLFCYAAATLCHLAWALPLTELGLRPNFLPGLVILLLGVLALLFLRRTAPTETAAEGRGNGIPRHPRWRA